MSKKTTEILLIQPPVMKRVDVEDPNIISFFKAINDTDGFLGDDPTEPNIGLLSIAASIRKWSKIKRVEAKITVLDLNIIERDIRSNQNRAINRNDIESEIRKYNPKIIGISFMTVTYGIWGNDLIHLCKSIHSSSIIILGGIHPTIDYKNIFQRFNNEISGIVVGEGELVFREIVNVTLFKNLRDLKKINGLYLGDNSTIAPMRLSSEQLDELPPPAYDLLEPKNRPIITRFYTVRGCEGSCKFCSTSIIHGNARAMPISTEKFESDFKKITSTDNKINISNFIIGDLSFLNNHVSSNKILRMLINMKKNEEFNFGWWCQTRADLLNADNVRLLKEAGCRQVAIGCEGGTDSQLRSVGKDESILQIETALKLLKENEISIQGYWIIGLPNETHTSIKETQNKIIQYLEDYGVIPHITILVPYPNTIIAAHPKINGIKILNENWDEYWMNCDLYGCGQPVYETINSRTGERLLSSEAIYKYWIETLILVTNKLNENGNKN